MGLIVVLAWVFTALLLILFLACIAAGRGVIPRNHWFGIRLPPLKRSDAAWRAGHAAGVAPSAVVFVIALVCCFMGATAPIAFWGAIVAFVGGLAWVGSEAIRAANKQN